MRGGKRPNAGRPKGEPTITFSTRIQEKHLKGLKEVISIYKQKIKDVSNSSNNS